MSTTRAARSASRQALMSREARAAYVADIRARIRPDRRRPCARRRRTSSGCRSRDARANALKLDWSGAYAPPRPSFLGTRVFDDYPLAELVDYIDWTPFFATWELTGQFPAILDDAKVGEAARSLYDDAQRDARRRSSTESWFRAAAVVGFWPANAEGDDILVFADEARAKPIAVLHTLRQQLAAPRGPRQRGACRFRRAAPSGIADYVGAFAVTAGLGEDEVADALQGRQRRLFRDHGQGAGRPPGRSLRRAAAPARAQGVLGLCGRTRRSRRAS